MTGFNAGRGLRTMTVALGLGAVAAMFMPVAASAEPELLIKAAHAASTGNTGHKALEFMDRELRERTDGRVGIQIFPNGQLGGERELIESIQLGNLDMAFVSSAPLANFDKRFYGFDIPFLFPDRAAAYAVFDGELGQEILAGLDQVGIHGLGYWENGFRQLTNDVKPVHSPDDLDGMKMRTMENDVHIALWRAEQADPAPLSFSELFTALQQGTFDAQEGPINLFYDMKFYEVQKYITVTNHIYSPLVVLAGPDMLMRMSDEDRATFDAVFAESLPYQRGLAKAADDDALEAMTEITVITLTDEEKQQFVDNAGPAVDLIRKKIGADAVDEILEAVAGNS